MPEINGLQAVSIGGVALYSLYIFLKMYTQNLQHIERMMGVLDQNTKVCNNLENTLRSLGTNVKENTEVTRQTKDTLSVALSHLITARNGNSTDS